MNVEQCSVPTSICRWFSFPTSCHRIPAVENFYLPLLENPGTAAEVQQKKKTVQVFIFE